jgi:hypothetical protein
MAAGGKGGLRGGRCRSGRMSWSSPRPTPSKYLSEFQAGLLLREEACCLICHALTELSLSSKLRGGFGSELPPRWLRPAPFAHPGSLHLENGILSRYEHTTPYRLRHYSGGFDSILCQVVVCWPHRSHYIFVWQKHTCASLQCTLLACN